LKDLKGCLHADPESSQYKKDTDTMLTGYEDPEFSIYEGCPVEVAINHGYLWESCVDIDNSKSFFLPSLPIAQAHAYKAFIVDRNVVEEQRLIAARSKRR